jgi:hypothetical protein
MTSSGILQLIKTPEIVESITHLGYPVYFLNILGSWKILGVLTILAPNLTLLKEWAYAGFFFTTSGALISHIVMREAFGDVFPSILLLTLTVVSWYFRPESRRIKTV